MSTMFAIEEIKLKEETYKKIKEELLCETREKKAFLNKSKDHKDLWKKDYVILFNDVESIISFKNALMEHDPGLSTNHIFVGPVGARLRGDGYWCFSWVVCVEIKDADVEIINGMDAESLIIDIEKKEVEAKHLIRLYKGRKIFAEFMANNIEEKTGQIIISEVKCGSYFCGCSGKPPADWELKIPTDGMRVEII